MMVNDGFIGMPVEVSDDHAWLGWVLSATAVVVDGVVLWTVLVEDNHDHRVRVRTPEKLTILHDEYDEERMDRLKDASRRREAALARTREKLVAANASKPKMVKVPGGKSKPKRR